MIKVLVDTDIGTDVDDAVALAYLLRQPECELLGITTVTGEAKKRASLASVLCQQAGKEIPIYPGAEGPMTGEQRQKVCQQAPALASWPHQAQFPQGEAVDFLRRTIREHPGEILLLTIGPLTNIGQLFMVDPEIPFMLKGMVTMGGLYSDVFPERYRIEWNVSADPRASAIVFHAPLRLHRLLGLDVTQQVMMSADEIRQRFTAPILRPVLDMAEIWFQQFYPFITFHDPLAAATIFDESLCSYQPGWVDADQIEKTGQTLFLPGGPDAPHQVATSVDVQGYFEHFFSIV
jgi:inosine-uridine nucleoside N-ribohydrolase